MKYFGWLLIPVFLAALMPYAGKDPGKIDPVALISLSADQGEYVVATDTGCRGTGETVEKALTALYAGSTKEIFIDTASCVVVTAQTKDKLTELAPYLSPGASVCVTLRECDPEGAAAFLKAHRPSVTIYQAICRNQRIPYVQIPDQEPAAGKESGRNE